jgi:predicted enzyme related to lactoylglutathione lyase
MTQPVVARFEITGQDSAELQHFYASLFDWTITEGAQGSGFGVVDAGEHGITGVIGPDRSGGNGHVTVYVEVDDLNAYLTKVEGLGGRTVVPPTEIAEFSLSFAFFQDPQGHLIGLSKGVIR